MNISTLYKGKEKKRLINNFISLFLLQVVSYIFPLMTMPYLARVIGVNGIGAIAFAVSVIAYFQTLTDWGFKYSAVRDIAKNRSNTEVVSTIFSTVMAARIVLMIASASILLALTFLVPIMQENSLLLWLTFLLIPGYIFFPDWLYQAMEEMKYITIMNIFTKTIFTVFVFVLIKNHDDYIYEPVINAIGYSVIGLVSYFYALRKFNIKFKMPKCRAVFHTIYEGKDMFLTQFLPTLYNNFAVILLGSYVGTTATGVFSAGNKFVNISDQFSNVLSRTFYPFLARRMDKHSVFVRITGVISIIMGVMLFICADLIVYLFYTPEFSGTATVIRIMSCSPFFLFLMNAYGTNGLVLIGKENILRNIILWCSIFGLLLSIVTIYYFSYIGVAITLASVWGVRGVLTYVYAKKNIQ